MIEKEFKVEFIKNFISQYEGNIFDNLVGTQFWGSMILIYTKFKSLDLKDEDSVEVEITLLSNKSLPVNMGRVQTESIFLLVEGV